jgi:hypothetical protein
MLQIVRLFWVGAAVLSAVLMAANLSYGVERERLTIRIDASTPAASFMPDEAFGAGLDGLEEDELKSTYSPENIKTMAGAPYRRLIYRLRPELGVGAWHWNEAGSWSDESKKEGYWTSSDKAERLTNGKTLNAYHS